MLTKIAAYKNSLSYSGAIHWNSFRCDWEAESLRQFKLLLEGDQWGTAFVESSFLCTVCSYFHYITHYVTSSTQAIERNIGSNENKVETLIK